MRRGFLVTLLALALARPAVAYVEAPLTLGAVISQSTIVCTMVVTKVDKQKNLIIYKKVQDVKGKHPQDEIKHNIGFGGLRPGEWQEIMNWAEVGKTAVFFHNGGASETYFGASYYQAYPQGEWWGMSHGEPFLLRSYSGKVDKLGGVVKEILDGKEVIVPGMVDGDKEALHKKTAKVQRLRASLKLQDYNPKRDFVGWGGDDIRRIAGMPGFDKLGSLGGTGPDALAASAIDFDGDGKLDIVLLGANRVMLLQNNGDGFSEVALPGFAGGARSVVWADYNADGLPDALLATPTGPRLFTNTGKGQFRDDSKLLPQEPCYNLTAAAWLDADGDGHPDVLLANGFHGLRLYRNLRGEDKAAKLPTPKLGEWHAVGPFRHKDGPQKNYETAFGPEKDAFDSDKVYKGKRDADVKWTKADYADGAAVGLAPFAANCAVYLHREIDMPAAADIPVSLGARDSLTVYLNGERVYTDKAARPLVIDQVAVTLKLKAGKNHLVLKLVHGEGEGGFTFKIGGAGNKPLFEDVSAKWGLGSDGPTASLKGDTLTVADFAGDSRPDFVYAGVLFVHAGGRYEMKADSGLNFKAGRVGPAAEGFDGDGRTDLFVPQTDGACKLYQNQGQGRFVDVTAAAGDLAKPVPGAVGASWGDFDNDGLPDLIVTRLRGPNRYFKNLGKGQFRDDSTAIGLDQKIFNSQAACLADLNGDGRLDLVLANEGQDSTVLFGSAATEAKKTPVTLAGVPVGGRVTVTGADGQRIATVCVTGADGRGGQSGLAPRVALAPGAYKLEVRGNGRTVEKAVTVAAAPLTVTIN
ncbi:FG-GAP repeat domain-containing protein [Limnoglobus roseus]|uniref:VCBS repeat-containing protein n=1 Tax=Limnoglobus roseus TaxID=2598579 RepID=A0A5C1AGE4_9BACT|nr:VCBS repeat-containing protein [Limnoglobus roseus]QEL17313.1 VCBS repeat-containing protein [Limnoglobus roseus]